MIEYPEFRTVGELLAYCKGRPPGESVLIECERHLPVKARRFGVLDGHGMVISAYREPQA